AHNAGDPESGGVAALAMVEELAGHLPFSELLAYYRAAESELENSQHPGVQTRLGKCARLLLTTPPPGLEDSNLGSSRSKANLSTQPITQAPAGSTGSTDFSLEEQVLHFEGDLIKQALESSDGSVTRAARILGITHQGLAFILNGRQKDLLTARRPVKRRRRSIMRGH
ncbi:MAG: hypothetical protein M3Y84_00475, partial [Acidobacteriota bacterium]|nr:hypothetical protein [Acidobacteriota bacterium]